MAKSYSMPVVKKSKSIVKQETPLPQELIREMRQVFDAVDTDRSGSISADEVHGIVERLGLNLNETQIRAFMNNIDKNSDGKIEFEEFSKEMAKTYSKKQSFDQLERAFKLFDKDNSGYITMSELSEFMKRFNGVFTEDQLEELMNKLDVSRDHKLSIDEFQKLLD